jgi:hypothetical protein
VVQYLAKVDFAIRFGVFANRFPELSDPPQAVDLYKQHPSRFIEDFGWPELGQLDADLLMWLGRGQRDEFTQHQGKGRYAICDKIQAGPEYSLSIRAGDKDNLTDELLANDVIPSLYGAHSAAAERSLVFRDHLLAIVQWTLRKDLAARESGSAVATLLALKQA